MKKNDIFMPVKICVLQAWPSFDDKNATKFYAKNGQPYFPMTVANVSFGTKTVEFTPDLYFHRRKRRGPLRRNTRH